MDDRVTEYDVEETCRRIRVAYDLQPHPEGGSYREAFRSDARVIDEHGRTRSALTVIYYLLAAGEHSTWHRLRADETWHFAAGGSLGIETIDEAGRHERLVVGPEGAPYVVVPGGRAFAARALDERGYALVTCCVAPGFEFDDFELLDPDTLAARHARHAETIARFPRRAGGRIERTAAG